MIKKNYNSRAKKKIRISKKISGTAERPRLAVYRSLNHIYAQLIDDTKRVTITSVSTKSKEVAEKAAEIKGKVGKSALVGEAIAEKAKKLGIESVVFDRAGYKYHGRVKAVAEGARKGGLVF